MARSRRLKLATRLNNMIAPFAPSLALGREAAMMRREVLLQQAGHYQGAGRSARGKDFRVNRTDAVEAMRGDRDRLSWIGRDMLRNNPRVKRIRRQLVNNVVGSGIRPSIKWLGEEGDPRKQRVEQLFKRHCMKLNFDADGQFNILGMQGLAFGSTAIDGEILLRRRFRSLRDGYPLNFQVQALEADYLNRQIDGELSNGNYAIDGIEFNLIGKRVAYHLFTDHPGGRKGGTPATRRVDAKNIIHVYDPERAGQVRGISWFAPVITLLHELQKYQDGQVKRQEIAALFAGILKGNSGSAEELEADIGVLEAGSILQIGDDETLDFTDPPTVEGYEPFMRVTDRVIAAAMGITYESMTGDYSNVNFSSGRMGRNDIDPNTRDWQENLMIGRMCSPLGEWTAEAIEDVADVPRDLWELNWTPPVRPVIDPSKEYKANETAMRSGQKSRRQVIREGGGDPEKVEAEIIEERQKAKTEGLVFSSDDGAKAQTPAKKETTND
ncbi:phage portal protein [Shimia thalassica]|uniref:phage portal protein n=1 Tax=Shimia thalassica TaxID=1715693 RepID=UPI001C095C5F|nr:phage portal protein [Shimia thalassica]MBU2941063.1 phage portal protein [Shimia thalassica]MDO6504210.1 phage portal protein [Shimia thalassica]